MTSKVYYHEANSSMTNKKINEIVESLLDLFVKENKTTLEKKNLNES